MCSPIHTAIYPTCSPSRLQTSPIRITNVKLVLMRQSNLHGSNACSLNQRSGGRVVVETFGVGFTGLSARVDGIGARLSHGSSRGVLPGDILW